MSKVIAEFKRRYEVQVGVRYYFPFSSEHRLEWKFGKAFHTKDAAMAYGRELSDAESDVRVLDLLVDGDKSDD